jgi:hypothetical protein
MAARGSVSQNRGAGRHEARSASDRAAVLHRVQQAEVPGLQAAENALSIVVADGHAASVPAASRPEYRYLDGCLPAASCITIPRWLALQVPQTPRGEARPPQPPPRGLRRARDAAGSVPIRCAARCCNCLRSRCACAGFWPAPARCARDPEYLHPLGRVLRAGRRVCRRGWRGGRAVAAVARRRQARAGTGTPGPSASPSASAWPLGRRQAQSAP